MNTELTEEISATAKILGAVFYHSPGNADVQEIMAVLNDENTADEWPAQAADAFTLIREGLSQPNALAEVFHELFIVPGENYVPHWGSVFLDEQNLMNGESTMALKDFLKKAGIKTDTGVNEPEDQIGIMLFIAAMLAERAEEALLAEFLNEHLLTWCYRYFELLEEKSDNSFYKGLAQLSAASVRDWAAKLKLNPDNKKLYL